ncbi:MAG TPA: polysaccharide biosynthesis/export family protein [Rhizomicrobium sp.]|nr:polysaccharide biosynthesis/export family protein [Rhizomicrobium sp.]
MRILMFSILTLVTIGCPLAAGAATSVPREPALRPDAGETVVVEASRENGNDYKLGPGDKVRVTVYGEEDLSGEFQVDSAGYLRLPLIGQVHAGGRSAYQLESEVESELENGYLRTPRVNVEVTTYRPFYILGQVNRPGQYAYVSNMSALDAVALAGGYTDHAVESTLYVRHEGETKEHEVPADESVKIRPGDVVRVEQTLFWSVASVLAPATSVISPAASLAYVLRP